MAGTHRSVLLVAGTLVALVAGVRATGAQPSPAPVAYVHAATLGSTDLPWQRSNSTLNQPLGLGADRDGVWIANAGGRNLVRFGTGPVEELGRAGSLEALYGRPARSLADVAVAFAPRPAGQPPTPTPTPDPDAGPPPPPWRMLWFADQGAHVVVGITVDTYGRISDPIILGEHGVAGADDLHFDGPGGVTADPFGYLYVADTGNHRVQVFGPDRKHVATLGVTGVAGNGPSQLDRPGRLVVAPDGRLYVPDTGNHRVLAFDIRNPRAPARVASYGHGPGPGPDQLDTPLGVAADATFVYVADSGNGRVQVLQKADGKPWRTLDGVAVAGCGLDNPAGRWDFVSDVALDEAGNVYVALPRHMRVQVCDAFDRAPKRAYGGLDLPYATRDGLYNAPAGLAVAPDGALTLVEVEGHRALRRAADGKQSWFFGVAGLAGAGAGSLAAPADVALLPDGRTVVADSGNGRLVVLDGSGMRIDTWGAGAVRAPVGLTVLRDGKLAVADAGTGRVSLVDASGNLSGAPPGAAAGPFTAPADVATDATGHWFVSDAAEHVVRRFDAAGKALAPLGLPGAPGDAFDRLRAPRGLAVAADGRLFVADTGNNRVQVFDKDGGYLTTLGGLTGPGTGDLREPRGVAVDGDGRVFVADTYNHRVQVFTAAAAPWLPAATNGFGRRGIGAVSALAELDGRLYAGVADPAAGAGIWRWDGTGPWEEAAPAGFAGAGHVNVASLHRRGDQLYAGTLNEAVTRDPSTGEEQGASRGGDLYRSADGLRWDKVASGGFGDAQNAGVSALADFGGQLYAGTRGLTADGTGAQLWRSGTGDAGTWARVRIDLFTRTEWWKNAGISAMTTYSNTLVVGTCAVGRPQVWGSLDGTVWRPIGFRAPDQEPVDAEPQLGSGTSPCVTSLAEFDGRLYAGLGGELDPSGPPREWQAGYRAEGPSEAWRCLRCDGTDWEPATSPGLGNRQNRGRVALMPFDEPPFRFLYLAVGNAAEGLELWRAMDGLDWEPLVSGGLGDDNNADVAGGAIAAFRGRLVVGTVNGASGGELWSTAGTRPGVLPTPPGPTATPTPRPSPQPPLGRARYKKAAEWPLGQPAPPDVLGGPVDMAVADDGTVYLLGTGPVRVARLLPDGSWAESFGGSGSGPDRITRSVDGAASAAIALDAAAGRVYVSDLGTERVVVYDLAGHYLESWPDVYAVDLDLRPDGSLWVADLLAGAVRRLGADGVEIERMGRFGPSDEDGLMGLQEAVEDTGGRLWVGDLGGDRLRSYERDGGGWKRVRTLDLSRPSLSSRGCSGVRLQVLGDNRVLAGRCVFDKGRVVASLPAQHPGSDLYFTGLHTVNRRAGLYYALATYDTAPRDDSNETSPAVVRYLDEGFDIVTDFWRGRWFRQDTAAREAVLGPMRLSTAPDDTLYLTDAFGLRRFTPEGKVVDQLGIRSYPSRGSALTMNPRLVVGTGEPGMVIGVGDYVYGRSGYANVVAYGRTVQRRHCQAGNCQMDRYLEPIWMTTLEAGQRRVPVVEHNYAVAHEPTRNQLVLLQLFVDNPSQIEFPARLFLFPVADRGRKTEILLEGRDRQALWTDVDAGPDGRIYVLDTLRDLVAVHDAGGALLGRLNTPKDAWKVAGGPNGEVYVLTTYGHLVRLAADGTVLSRFVALPNTLAPFTAQVDLAVDAGGRVFVADDLYQQVTVFEPEGSEDEVLEGGRCTLAGDKWVAPGDILLGDSAALFLTLFGSCGYQEEPADIVLAINATAGSEVVNLQVARQILGLVDLDRHRVGLVSFVVNALVESRLTQDRDTLIRKLYDLTGGRPTGCGANTLAALRMARDVFEDAPGRRKVLILIGAPLDPARCSYNFDTIAAGADELKARGILIVGVNSLTVAPSSEVLAGIGVAPRGQGVGRPALRRTVTRRWPDSLIQRGTLTDQLPANIDYVPGSANPPATWDGPSRTLTWDLKDLARTLTHSFTLRIRPREEGLWPTNVQAVAEGTDGWGNPIRAVLPIPRIRVYGEPPPTPTSTPTRTPTPSATLTPEPTPTPRPTRPPVPIYLPILLKTEPCLPGSRNADVAVVIDTSGSMSQSTSPGGPVKLDAARAAARSFVRQLVAGRDQAALVQFNHTATVIVPLTADTGAVDAGLDRLTQAIGTRIDLALDAAAAELTGPSRRAGNNPVIILLTDGQPTGATPDEVRAAAQRAHGAGLLVFTIGLGQDLDHALLRDIATLPEWYFAAPDTSELEAIYRQIAYRIPCKPMWP